jgi:sialate O-acetylesterase
LNAEVKLSPLFNNNMVLQQGMEIPVWGWASSGEKVTVTFDKTIVSAKANDEGEWTLKLPAMNYGGPFKMTVKGKNLLTFENIMIGEVWLCSGQSNMEYYLINSDNGKAEIAESDYPEIRLFTVKKRISQTPQVHLGNEEWRPCSPSTSPQFSAVAYFYAKELYNRLNVPIGIINTAWGGTLAESWTSNNMISKNPDFADQMAQLKKIDLDEYTQNFEKKVKLRVDAVSNTDLGMKGDDPIWAASDLDDANWKEMKLPAIIEQNGLDGVDGIVWFRKEVEILLAEEGKSATLYLAKVNDSDNTYLNGTLIASNYLIAEKPRVYNIPAGILKQGKNIIAVQVEDVGNKGGIYGDSTALKLKLQNRTISLSGNWKYKVGLVKYNAFPGPNAYPTLLYNGMINPLVPFGMKGVIWYQGEGNAKRAKQYQRVFPDMIKDWRNNWNQGEFPFLFVQLAAFMKRDSASQQSAWAELREAQSMALALPNTGMAVIIDVGDEHLIHPTNKEIVGKRLVLSALKVAYKQDVIFSGPVYKSMNVNGDKVTLFFNEVGDGLKTKEKTGNVKGFALAGLDRKYYWARGKVTGKNTLELYCPEVPNPVAVRYAWGNNPDSANLYNSADLPASPFRTDQWKGITE